MRRSHGRRQSKSDGYWINSSGFSGKEIDLAKKATGQKVTIKLKGSRTVLIGTLTKGWPK